MTKNDLILIAGNYAKYHNISMPTVSMRVAQNGNFYKRLVCGGGCNLATYSKHLHWFSDNWPEVLEWPKDIDRPDPTKTQAKGAA